MTMASPVAEPLENAPQTGEPVFPAGLRVLVVDDDPLCLRIVDAMLRKCQYIVTTCTNGVDALAELRGKEGTREAYDIVLSDVQMPDIGGFKLLELIGLEMNVPVIMMSANSDTSVVMKGVTHGAVDYLLKPIRIEELRNIWQHVIRKKKKIRPADGGQGTRSSDEGGGKGEDDGGIDGDGDGDEDESRAEKRRRGDKDGGRDDDIGALKKSRVVWSVSLHQQFVNAVNQLGVEKAVPKRILDLMCVSGLTRENVASHLQKYRLYLKRLSVHGEGDQGGISAEMMLGLDPRGMPLPGGKPGMYHPGSSSMPAGGAPAHGLWGTPSHGSLPGMRPTEEALSLAPGLSPYHVAPQQGALLAGMGFGAPKAGAGAGMGPLGGMMADLPPHLGAGIMGGGDLGRGVVSKPQQPQAQPAMGQRGPYDAGGPTHEEGRPDGPWWHGGMDPAAWSQLPLGMTPGSLGNRSKPGGVMRPAGMDGREGVDMGSLAGMEPGGPGGVKMGRGPMYGGGPMGGYDRGDGNDGSHMLDGGRRGVVHGGGMHHGGMVGVAQSAMAGGLSVGNHTLFDEVTGGDGRHVSVPATYWGEKWARKQYKGGWNEAKVQGNVKSFMKASPKVGDLDLWRCYFPRDRSHELFNEWQVLKWLDSEPDEMDDIVLRVEQLDEELGYALPEDAAQKATAKSVEDAIEAELADLAGWVVKDAEGWKEADWQQERDEQRAEHGGQGRVHGEDAKDAKEAKEEAGHSVARLPRPRGGGVRKGQAGGQHGYDSDRQAGDSRSEDS
eukprot:jgi/Mesvir1/4026/Mv05823-RA.1